MNYFDIIIIAIVVFWAMVGILRGFGKTMIKLLCFVLAMGATYMLMDVVVDFISQVEFLRNFVIGDGFSLKGMYEGFANLWIADPTGEGADTGIAGLFVTPLMNHVNALGGASAFGLGPDELVSIVLAINSFNIILCLLMYFVIRIVASIIGFILRKIFVHGVAGGFSRLIGFIFGAVRGAAWAAVLLVVCCVIFPINQEWAKDLRTTANESFIVQNVGSYVYEGYDWAMYGNEDSGEKLENMLKKFGYERTTTGA